MTFPTLRAAIIGLAAVTSAWTQAPILQDGAVALRREETLWVLGETPLPPLPIPSLEVGLGGAGSEGPYTPLASGEGQGHGVRGWGLGLQGRFVSGGWSVAATLLGLRDAGRTTGILLRAALAYQWESGWRLALEQQPAAWGSGLGGGDLLGDAARPFPRLSLATPEVSSPAGRWRAEAFAGRLERDRAIPEWISDRDSRIVARAGELDLRGAELYGGRIRVAFGALVEAEVGAITMAGGEEASGAPAAPEAARTTSLAELKLRAPWLAGLTGARGAALHLGRSAAPEGRAITLAQGRTLGGGRLIWEAWDLGLEYAGAAPAGRSGPYLQPTHLAGWSTHGDPLGPVFDLETVTRTLELGLPLFLEGQGRIRVVRATAASNHPLGTGAWVLQGEAQWRTPTGRIGAALASRRDEIPGSQARWGWAFSLFQAFRVL